MLQCHVWEGLDRLSFFENAILLGVNSQTQGQPIKRGVIQSDANTAIFGSQFSNQLFQNFLDDFALVVAGAGGKDNVSAVCMDVDEPNRTFILRLARNEGLDDETLLHLRRILQLMTQSLPTSSFHLFPLVIPVQLTARQQQM